MVVELPQSTNYQRLGRKIKDEAKDITTKVSRAITAGLATCDERGQDIDAFSKDEITVESMERKPTKRIQNAVDTSKPRILGKPNFKFNVIQKLDDDGTIIEVEGKTSNGQPLNVDCKWTRQVGQYKALIEHTGKSYRVTADDIGAVICVEATRMGSTDMGIAECGPYEIDDDMRRKVEDIMTTEFLELQISVMYLNKDFTSNDLSAHVPDPSRGGQEWTFCLSGKEVSIKRSLLSGANTVECSGIISYNYPKIQLSPGSPTAFVLHMDNSTVVNGSCLSKAQRDLFSIALRVLQGKLSIGVEAMVELVTRQNTLGLSSTEARSMVRQASHSSTGAEGSALTSDLLDVFVYIERLTSTLKVCNRTNIKLKQYLENTTNERDAIHEELEATISAYQEIISASNQAKQSSPTTNDPSMSTAVAGSVVKVAKPVECNTCSINEKRVLDTVTVTEQYKQEVDSQRQELARLRSKYREKVKEYEVLLQKRNDDDEHSQVIQRDTKFQVFDANKKYNDEKILRSRVQSELDTLKKTFMALKQKYDGLVSNAKQADMDKTAFIDQTRRPDASQHEYNLLNEKISSLKKENESLREKVRKLAHA